MDNIHPIIIVVIILLTIPVFLYFIPLGLWFSATLSGVRFTLVELIFMRLRRSPVQDIVLGMITATKAGVIINRDELEAHSLAEGNIVNVVNGLVSAKKAGLGLTFENACLTDFKGIDLVKAVKQEVESRKKKEKIFE